MACPFTRIGAGLPIDSGAAAREFRHMASRYHVFETAAGFVAIGWGERGITSLRLPEATADAAIRALLRRLSDARVEQPVGAVAETVSDIMRYFAGERAAFDTATVDLGAQEPFFTRVYDHIRKLGWGETTTYGAIAAALGAGPAAAQSVGQAMARNPVPLIVPCHRVLAAGGRIGGFSAPGGSESKAKMLALEGVAVATPKPEPVQAAFVSLRP